jgi:hypothetical protein
MACILAGCNATDTGNPFDGDDREGGPSLGGQCEEVAEEIELAADTELGFAADELLSAIAGDHQTTLRWFDSENADRGSEQELSSITISVEPAGTARYVVSRPGGGDGAEISLGGLDEACRDRIEVDVVLEIVSAGGALDERVETVLSARNPDFAGAEVQLSADEVGGELELVATPPPGFEPDGPPKLQFDVGFSSLGITGRVNSFATFRSSDGAVGQGGGQVLAQWPAEAFCDSGALAVPVDQAVRGLSVAAAVEAYNAQSPMSARYSDGAEPSEVGFELGAADGFACQDLSRPLDEARSVEFDGELRLTTADGTLDGVFSVVVGAETEPGSEALRLVRVSASEFSDDPARMEMLPAAFGIHETFELGAYDQVSVDFASELSEAAWGILRVNGFVAADCVTNPPEPDPDGMGAPGCRGSDIFEVWKVSFGDAPDQ